MNAVIKQRLFRILNLCLDAKEKGHDVFFEYSPHTQGLEIRVYESGWKNSPDEEVKPPTKYIQFYLDKHDTNERLKEVEEYLKELV